MGFVVVALPWVFAVRSALAEFAPDPDHEAAGWGFIGCVAVFNVAVTVPVVLLMSRARLFVWQRTRTQRW